MLATALATALTRRSYRLQLSDVVQRVTTTQVEAEVDEHIDQRAPVSPHSDDPEHGSDGNEALSLLAAAPLQLVAPDTNDTRGADLTHRPYKVYASPQT